MTPPKKTARYVVHLRITGETQSILRNPTVVAVAGLVSTRTGVSNYLFFTKPNQMK